MNSPEQPAGKPVDNHLAWSIVSLVVTFFTCCMCYTLPSLGTAITALVFSTKVNSALTQGDLGAAEAASRNARLFNMITLGLLIGGIAVWCVIFFIGGGMAGQQEMLEEVRRAMEKAH